MFDLLWAERRKLKRSKILWAAIFGTVMIAAIVFASGLDRYQGPEMQYGVKTLTDGTRYIENAGWFMDEVQPWSVFFVLPAVVALLGSYMICREEEEDTLKCLRMIPVNEAKLTIAKMIIAFAASILLYLLLFAITLLVEMVLHVSVLSSSLIFTCFKEYLLTGIGVFLAVSPIIAFASRVKKYWLALVAAEIYSVAGLFAGMASISRKLYPVTTLFNFSGYQLTSSENVVISIVVLLLCAVISGLILMGLNPRQKGEKGNGKEII